MPTRAKVLVSCVLSATCLAGLCFVIARWSPERRGRLADEAPRRTPAPATPPAPLPTPLEPALATGFTVTVKVTDSETLAPIADANVRLDPAPDSPAGGSAAPDTQDRSGMTDSRGAFEAKGIVDGNYILVVSAKGYITAISLKPVELTSGGKHELAVALDPGGSISGRVLDQSGKPVPGAIVQPDVSADTVDTSDEQLVMVLKMRVPANVEGRYVLDGLPARKDYVVRASHTDFAPASAGDVTIAAREGVEDLNIVLLRGGSIAGRVIDDGSRGVAGVKVWAIVDSSREERFIAPGETIGDDPRRMPDARTDAEGTFRIEHLPPGGYGLYARDSGPRLLPGEATGVEVVVGKSTEIAEIVLGAGERLAGRVVDPMGQPIAGAEVLAPGAAKAMSAADGAFEITGLARGKANINVVKKGYDILIDEPEVPAHDVVFTLIPTGAILGRIRFKDQENFPQFRISVSCRTPDGIEEFFATSRDPRGSFEVEGKAGVYVLTALVEGFAPSKSAEIRLAAHERKEGVVIDLERGASIRGRVIAKLSGEPIENADISVTRSAEQGEDRWKPATGGGGATSGPDGAFVLAGVLEGKVDLEVRHSDHPPIELTGIDVHASKPSEVTVEMGEGGRIRGTAHRRGKPASGVTISAMRIGSHTSYEARTDSEGRFELRGLEEDEYVLKLMTALSGGGRMATHAEVVVVKNGEIAEVDLVEPAPVQLAGRVLSDGVPVRGGRIKAVRPATGDVAEGEIDPSGTYSLDLPGGGLYVLEIHESAEGDGVTRMEVAVPADVSEARRDIDLPVGEVSGVVVDASSGDPIAGAQVWAVPRDAPSRTPSLQYRSVRSTAVAGKDGGFVLEHLVPGEYSLRAFISGHADGRVDALRVDAARVGDIRIPLEAGVRLAARIIDPGKRPVSDAVALLRLLTGDLAALEPTMSNDNGLVEFLAPREGPYRLIVLHDSFAPVSMPVQTQTDAGPIIVPLLSGGKLRVRLADAFGKRVEAAEVHVVGDGGEWSGEDFVSLFEELGFSFVTQVDGYLVLRQMPPGAYRVAARKGDAATGEEKVTVSEGRTTELRLTLRG
ncbi:MAG TPA: carboxypeptidase-like regulatory domain-containing protein [Planctomycetota bacterium]|nr:carboxypeptidase-like regulatory domain-containing protein [Planctomycetota bacterium]